MKHPNPKRTKRSFQPHAPIEHLTLMLEHQARLLEVK
jgi:hypothetical protein